MNADYVENIIRNIDKQSYKCILVDGAWGIGKSYMVRKALEDMKDRTCFISLFGMDDVQKIYHEALLKDAICSISYPTNCNDAAVKQSVIRICSLSGFYKKMDRQTTV